MRKQIIIVDDFYDDPHQVRDGALQHGDFREVGTWPGKGWDDAPVDQATMDVFAHLVGAPSIWWVKKIGKFRLATASEAVTKGASGHHFTCHVDGYDDPPQLWGKEQFAALVYLSRDEDCKGGTSFFKHKPTGLVALPHDKQDLVPLSDYSDPSKWEKWNEVPMRFNRCLIFQANLFHHQALPYGFGDRPENARLTHNFWFYTQNPTICDEV